MIIGIAGTIGSGKGTVVEYLKKKGFVHFSSSGILRETLSKRKLPATRLHMSTLANELIEQHPGGVLYLSHKKAEANGIENYILEAIHRKSEADYVRSIGGKVLGVDADLHTRYERSILRGDGEKDAVTFEQFEQDAHREDEGHGATGPNIRAVLRDADSVLMNNGTTEELYAQVEEMLAELSTN
tara:strand:+ start:561827 stop:562381 length:555 start_codon:yes stop_codon:yes gene_type:complete